MFCYNVINDVIDCDLSHICSLNIGNNNYNLRNNNDEFKIVEKKARLDMVDKFFSFRISYVWNIVDPDIRCIELNDNGHNTP